MTPEPLTVAVAAAPIVSVPVQQILDVKPIATNFWSPNPTPLNVLLTIVPAFLIRFSCQSIPFVEFKTYPFTPTATQTFSW